MTTRTLTRTLTGTLTGTRTAPPGTVLAATTLATAGPRAIRLRRTLLGAASGRLFAAYWGCLGLVDLTRSAPDVVGVAAVAVLVAGLSVRQRPLVALALAGTGWLFVTGFVVHSLGVLAVGGPADAVRLGVLVAAATAVSALGRRTGRR